MLKSDVPMIGKTLRKFRLQKGVTQSDVAKAVGVTRAAYSYYETDKIMPSVWMRKSLAEYFGVSPDIFYVDGTTPSPDTATSLFSKLDPEDGKKVLEYARLLVLFGKKDEGS